jgi:hypothetical protein
MQLVGLASWRGQRDDALELVGGVYNWVPEAFDTHDLKQAKALLTDLAA